MSEKTKDVRRGSSGDGKIRNAEEFGNYVHAVTIPMKIMMASIVVFFVGALAYCAFGQVPVSISCAMVSQDQAVCYVKAEDLSDIEPGDEVDVADGMYSVASVSTEATVVDESINSYAREIGGLELGDYVFTVTVDGDINNGTYQADIIKGRLNPLAILLEG